MYLSDNLCIYNNIYEYFYDKVHPLKAVIERVLHLHQQLPIQYITHLVVVWVTALAAVVLAEALAQVLTQLQTGNMLLLQVRSRQRYMTLQVSVVLIAFNYLKWIMQSKQKLSL